MPMVTIKFCKLYFKCVLSQFILYLHFCLIYVFLIVFIAGIVAGQPVQLYDTLDPLQCMPSLVNGRHNLYFCTFCMIYTISNLSTQTSKSKSITQSYLRILGTMYLKFSYYDTDLNTVKEVFSRSNSYY